MIPQVPQLGGEWKLSHSVATLHQIIFKVHNHNGGPIFQIVIDRMADSMGF
jgi:hypothetical protein